MPGTTRESSSGATPSATPSLEPIRSSRRLRLLDDGQLADLRAATLEILETIGVHVPSERVRREYEAHGALVDHAAHVVRLPPDLVLASYPNTVKHVQTETVMGARMAFSSLTGRRAPDGSAVEPRDVARATVDRLLREHHPEPLDERVSAELARIVAAADGQAVAAGARGG